MASYYEVTRALVFDHYGRLCRCCGSWRSLTIDHVDGHGAEHREELGNPSTRQFYRWLIVHNYPPGFQTLCFHCNSSKKRGQFCALHRKLLTGVTR